MDLESYLGDPRGLMTNLDPPLTSQKVFWYEIITVFQSADVQYRESLQNWSILFIMGKVRRGFISAQCDGRFRFFMGVVLKYPDGYVL